MLEATKHRYCISCSLHGFLEDLNFLALYTRCNNLNVGKMPLHPTQFENRVFTENFGSSYFDENTISSHFIPYRIAERTGFA
jgi:hypothetical protein